MIEIVPYRARWAQEFAELGAQIRAAVGQSAQRIDHIGSTSVPGLASKDILDLMLTVADLNVFDSLIPLLEPLRIEPELRIRSDHPQAGTQLAPVEWEKRYFVRMPGYRDVHLHVRAAGRANQRYALLFRDYLRAAPAAAQAYANLKHQLAAYHGDSDDHAAYVEIKDPVCDIIMVGAEAWAASTRWTPGPSDA